MAIARFAPPVTGRAARAALIGAGVQGHSHLPVIGHVLPGVELAIHDRDGAPGRATGRGGSVDRGDRGGSSIAADAAEAVAGADVVVTAASFTSPEYRQSLHADDLAPDALVVPIDYATMIAADVARSAALFLVDDAGSSSANRDAGQFDAYPDPMATIGQAILAGTPRPAIGRVLVTHLGVGLADVVFGEAILRRAIAAGLGTVLDR